MCKDFLNTIPLISLLGSKAMRPRHWLMLMKATGESAHIDALGLCSSFSQRGCACRLRKFFNSRDTLQFTSVCSQLRNVSHDATTIFM